jgi:hypothetical protein
VQRISDDRTFRCIIHTIHLLRRIKKSINMGGFVGEDFLSVSIVLAQRIRASVLFCLATRLCVHLKMLR